MCNRYRAASVVRIRDAFGFTYIESGPPMEDRYRTSGIGPLQPGPIIRRRELVVGQWGLTPDGNETLKPMNRRTGRPMSTNNARWNPARQQPEARSFWGPWDRGQRCIIPVEDFDEPYWGHGGKQCIWWRFRRADGAPLAVQIHLTGVDLAASPLTSFGNSASARREMSRPPCQVSKSLRFGQS